jgi:hypothetical protein
MSTRQPPMGTPQLSTHAGLTPQMSIVDANGRPTMFFFRWLLTIGGAALTSDDLSILESFDPGADAALTESAIADALDAAQLAADFDDGGAARAELAARVEELALAGALRSGGLRTGPRSDQRALEALIALPAPADPPVVMGRDVFANIPTGLNQGDTGKLFYATDRKLTYIWTGAAWQIVVNYEPVIADTLANWTAANYNPANYAAGQQFLVTTWQVTYTVEGSLWTYSGGTYIAPAASRPATAFNGAALGPLDIGLLFLASDTLASSYWNGAAWVAYPTVAGAPPTGPAGGELSGTYPNPQVKTVTAITPFIQIGGSATGITFTNSVADVTRIGVGPGSVITVQVQFVITAWPASPVGAVTIGTFPTSVARASGTVLTTGGFVGLTPGTQIIPNLAAGTGIVTLQTQGAAATVNLSPTVIAAGAGFILQLSYLSAS